PKPHGGGTRVLGVPCIADRIAQTVVARRLGVEVEPIFHPDSYGYRPNRSALDAVAACRQRCWRANWVIDLDVERFFDSVPWDLVVKAVGGAYQRPVGGALRQAVACCTAGATRRELAAAGPRYSARVCGLARAGKPVPALRVRRLD